MSPTPLRLLLLEDSDSDADTLLLELGRAGYQPVVTRVETARDFRQALRAGPWDLLIADYNLPSFNGLEALAIYRESGLDVPVFLISGTVGEELAVEAMTAGAHDYLLKDNLTRLGPAVRRELREAQVRRDRRSDIERLVASERRFTEIFRNSPVAMMVTAIDDGTVHDINQAALDLFGFTREEVVGRSTSEIGGWRDLGAPREIVEHSTPIGRSLSFERQVRSKKGTAIVVQVSCNTIELDGINRLVVTMQDITARKAAEATLRASEERFRLLVENSNELVIEVALDGTVLYASPNHATITGRAAGEIAGRSAFANVHPDNLAEIRAKFHSQDTSAIFRCRFADGSWHWLESSGRFFRLASGEERGVIVSRDVSQRIEAEQTRKKLEEQLRQAQKLEALGTLAGGIAHDFNNILTAIMAYTDLAAIDAERPEEVGKHLSEVRRASDRARDLVRQILAFSRQQKHERKPVRLEPVIREVVKLLRSTLPATIEIDSQIDPGGPVVLADTSQIHQVVMNLATNAAHAMQGEPGRLTVRLEGIDADEALVSALPELRRGAHACLTVSDTGRGMTPEVVKRIFEPFFTTKEPGEGTGLGLAVVHGIVSDHEGAIALESSPHAGTTFRIYFPAHDATETLVEAEPASQASGNGEHVLFIDDERPICEMARKILRQSGFRVSAHSDPREALDRFLDRPEDFQIVVTDLTMPRLTGVDVARVVLDRHPGIPVLVLSGFSATWTAETLREIGVRELLTKPFSLTELVSAVRRVLDEPAPSR